MSIFSSVHLLIVFVGALIAGLLVVALRWVALLIQAYHLAERHFGSRTLSYPALMHSHTKGNLQVVALEADSQGTRNKGHSLPMPTKKLRLRKDALALPSAIGEASITSALMLQDLLAVDSHFYDAMSSLAGHQISGFADLHQQVSRFVTNGWGEMSPHVVDNVQGHLAEQLVAEHLRHLGHHVEMAATSNQSGWNMVADHAFRVNVKDYANPSGFGEHFQHNPDVAVVVPHAIAAGPADFDASTGLDHRHHAFQAHQSVISDGGLDHDAVASHAHHALNSAHGHVPMHFPVITVCLSGWREANLLMEGSTDMVRSTTNVALDAAGTGFGGMAGLATGALIGTAIFPGVGTVIGGLLGAIAGELGGRAITNSIKEAPLREARERYLATHRTTQALMGRTRRSAEAKYSNHVSLSNQLLAREADAQNQNVEKTQMACKQGLLQAAALSENEIAELTAGVRTRLHKERRQAELRLSQSWRPLKFIWPDAGMVRDYITFRFTQKRCEVFADRFVQIERSITSAPVRTAAYLQVSLNLGYGVEEAKRHFNKVSRQSEASRAHLSRLIGQAKNQMLWMRAEQVVIFQRRTREIAQEMEDAVRDAVSQLKEHEAALQKELKAFGRA